MEVRYLDSSEKKRCRSLWEEAFPEDSASFVDYYMEEKTKDNRILVLEENGRILSMLHRNPYEVYAGDRLWKCDYIVGVATAEAGRRRGYMRRLMERALADMRAEGMPFSFLMPAAKEIYLPFGFTFIFDQPEWELPAMRIQDSTLAVRQITGGASEELMESAGRWMERWLGKRYEVFTRRDAEYMRRLVKEMESENGTLEEIQEKGKTAGFLGTWGLDGQEQRLLLAEPPLLREKGRARPAVMARIVSLPDFVKVIRLVEEAPAERLVFCLEITDELLAENQGVFRWTLDRTASFLERMSAAEDGKDTSGIIKIHIRDLTAWLFGYRVPGKLPAEAVFIRPIRGVFLDEVV
ncbi:MAG: enhanced intracellular survival protein Eis [Blautia sp.]|uniref:GNAT family N-acetyltransferase n=1 Tax=unclassified Blautia TaxID=2648079 RepID=UPI001FD4DF54|nr:GNAT family N-acetyltransferase [Blautia sp. NSJ-175]MCJ7845130.1 GNAT family N-acetyltransferase [Blautia sp. NSJ-175]